MKYKYLMLPLTIPIKLVIFVIMLAFFPVIGVIQFLNNIDDGDIDKTLEWYLWDVFTVIFEIWKM